MPLSPDPTGESQDAESEGIRFAMFNGEDRIVCRVAQSTLRDRAIADGTEPDDIAGAFDKHRATFEQIASELLDAGEEMPVFGLSGPN